MWLAQDTLLERKRSAPPARASVQNDDAQTAQFQLSLRPMNPIQLIEDLAGTSGLYTVRQIRHRLSVQGYYLETDLVATYNDPALTPFRLDHSLLDSADLIRY